MLRFVYDQSAELASIGCFAVQTSQPLETSIASQCHV
jgi:hypothetical protein